MRDSDMPMRERQAIATEFAPPFSILEPTEQTTPVVFCSPHSGRIYPSVLREASSLDELANFVTHDWSVINPQRAAWIERFNKEVTK